MSKIQNIRHGSEFKIYTYNVDNIKLLDYLKAGNLPSNSVIINAASDKQKNDTYIDFVVVDDEGQGNSILPDKILKYDDKHLSVKSDTKMLTSTFDKMYPEEYKFLNSIAKDLYGVKDFNELCAYWNSYSYHLPYEFKIDKKFQFINAKNTIEVKQHLLDKYYNPYQCCDLAEVIYITGIKRDNSLFNIVVNNTQYGINVEDGVLKTSETYEINGKAELGTYSDEVQFEYSGSNLQNITSEVIHNTMFNNLDKLNISNILIQQACVGQEGTINVKGSFESVFDNIHYQYIVDFNFGVNYTIGYLTDEIRIVNVNSNELKNYVSEQPIGKLDVKFKFAQNQYYTIFDEESNVITNNSAPWKLLINNGDGLARIYDNSSTEAYKFVYGKHITNLNVVNNNKWNDELPMPLIATKLKNNLICKLFTPNYSYNAYGENYKNCPMQWIITKKDENNFSTDIIGNNSFELGNQYITLGNSVIPTNSLHYVNNENNIPRIAIRRAGYFISENPSNIEFVNGVQGIGFKLDKNYDDFNFKIPLEGYQLYGTTKEFLTTNTNISEELTCYFNELYNLEHENTKLSSNYYLLLNETEFAKNNNAKVDITEENDKYYFEFTKVNFGFNNKGNGINEGKIEYPFLLPLYKYDTTEISNNLIIDHKQDLDIYDMYMRYDGNNQNQSLSLHLSLKEHDDIKSYVNLSYESTISFADIYGEGSEDYNNYPIVDYRTYGTDGIIWNIGSNALTGWKPIYETYVTANVTINTDLIDNSTTENNYFLCFNGNTNSMYSLNLSDSKNTLNNTVQFTIPNTVSYTTPGYKFIIENNKYRATQIPCEVFIEKDITLVNGTIVKHGYRDVMLRLINETNTVDEWEGTLLLHDNPRGNANGSLDDVDITNPGTGGSGNTDPGTDIDDLEQENTVVFNPTYYVNDISFKKSGKDDDGNDDSFYMKLTLSTTYEGKKYNYINENLSLGQEDISESGDSLIFRKQFTINNVRMPKNSNITCKLDIMQSQKSLVSAIAQGNTVTDSVGNDTEIIFEN